MRRWSRSTGAAAVACAVLGAGLAAAPAHPVSACDRLSIPSVSIDRCVVAGGQPEIDAGGVVRVDELSNAGRHWIAGHRTSHGAAFSGLASLQLGDLVRYRGAIYRIDEYRLVDRLHPSAIFDWLAADGEAIVLQTSDAGDDVHTWRAVPTDLGALVAQSAGVDTAAVPAALGPDGVRLDAAPAAMNRPGRADASSRRRVGSLVADLVGRASHVLPGLRIR